MSGEVIIYNDSMLLIWGDIFKIQEDYFSTNVSYDSFQIVDTVIQKDKLYGEEAHANLHHDVRAAIYTAVNECVAEGKYNKRITILLTLSF